MCVESTRSSFNVVANRPMPSINDSAPLRRPTGLSHNFLAPSGNLAGAVGYGDSSPQAVWDGLIKLHPDIRFVLSGDLTQIALRHTPGSGGKIVYQLLTDYQDEGNG